MRSLFYLAISLSYTISEKERRKAREERGGKGRKGSVAWGKKKLYAGFEPATA